MIENGFKGMSLIININVINVNQINLSNNLKLNLDNILMIIKYLVLQIMILFKLIKVELESQMIYYSFIIIMDQ